MTGGDHGPPVGLRQRGRGGKGVGVGWLSRWAAAQCWDRERGCGLVRWRRCAGPRQAAAVAGPISPSHFLFLFLISISLFRSLYMYTCVYLYAFLVGTIYTCIQVYILVCISSGDYLGYWG